jgi:hypothetical protein
MLKIDRISPDHNFQFIFRWKSIMMRKLITLIIISTIPLIALCSCGLSGNPTTPNVQTTSITFPDNPRMEELINWIRDKGNNDTADQLVSYYASEPDVSCTLSYFEWRHPGMAKLMLDQPWLQDGLDDTERTFIKYGTGQFAEWNLSSDNKITDIIVNQRWSVDTVSLNGGQKVILLFSSDKDEINEGITSVKRAAPIVELQLGITYPRDHILVNFIGTSATYSSGGDGGIDICSEWVSGADILGTMAHELTHVMYSCRPNGNQGSPAGIYFEEGLAELLEYTVLEAYVKVDNNIASTWGSKSVDQMYEYRLNIAKSKGWWRYPLGDEGSRSNYDIYTMEFLFMKDLRDVMGFDYFTKMCRDVWIYKANLTKYMPLKDWEDFVLNGCPNDEMKSKVQQLFDERVWGK